MSFADKIIAARDAVKDLTDEAYQLKEGLGVGMEWDRWSALNFALTNLNRALAEEARIRFRDKLLASV